VIDEGEVIGTDSVLGDALHLEVPEVEGSLNLVVGADVLTEDLERRDVHDGDLRPRVRFLPRRAPGGHRTPVVRDQDRV
jgi:hypothetical protein